MTSLVLAIALAMPAALFTAMENVRLLAGGVEVSARITLFLDKTVGDRQAQELAREIDQRTAVAETTYISRDQALAEFRAQSGFGDVLDLLDENPLPPVILVKLRPVRADQPGNDLQALAIELEALDGVDDVVMDSAWLERLQILIETGRSLALALGVALGLGVLLIMGNTIRLAIENRREEIVVVKLIGGTNGYVRRPFLYSGFCYGMVGGVLAWVLVWLGVLWLTGPVARLAGAYQSSYVLAGPGIVPLLILFACGALLGLAGSWIAVTRHLDAIEPE
jgi:cell division transport system permease protein